MRKTLLRQLPFACGAALAAVALHGACSPDSGLSVPQGGTTSGGGGDDFGTDGGLFDDSGVLPDPDAACGLVTEQAVSVPLNLYVVMDRSQSMVGDKWDSAKVGLAAFLSESRFAGTQVAFGLFPREDAPTCDQFAYKEPVVPFGALPGNAAAILQAINAANPDGFSTPIYPALGGALLKGIEVAQNNPGQASAVLLVTDGQPQGPASMCGGVNPEDPAAIAALAAQAAGFRPPVRTYVIGLPGVNQSIANQIAAAGGTDSAVLVSRTNVAVEFQQALAKVTGEALPCDYAVPSEVAGGDISFGDVNVLFSVDGAPEAILPQSPDCSGPGWRYDNPSAPTAILLCAASCDAVKEASAAKIQILLGCKTEIR